MGNTGCARLVSTTLCVPIVCKTHVLCIADNNGCTFQDGYTVSLEHNFDSKGTTCTRSSSHHNNQASIVYGESLFVPFEVYGLFAPPRPSSRTCVASRQSNKTEHPSDVSLKETSLSRSEQVLSLQTQTQGFRAEAKNRVRRLRNSLNYAKVLKQESSRDIMIHTRNQLWAYNERVEVMLMFMNDVDPMFFGVIYWVILMPL